MPTATSRSSASLSADDDDDEGNTDVEVEDDQIPSTTVPKVEELDETPIGGLSLSHPSTSNSPEHKSTDTSSSRSAEPKKKRGRPRKNPQITRVDVKSGKCSSRSKTGCITCRRRKKKCDETKPTCDNCKNNVLVCEGYMTPQVWKGGTKRSEELRRLSFTTHQGLPAVVDGIETDMDCRFFRNFVSNTSRILTVHDNKSIPFQDLLLPMAEQDKGLMHSLLALSGLHIIQLEPDPSVIERQHHHFTAAISILNASVATVSAVQDSNEVTVEDAIVASTIVQCLICICGGLTKGEYRMHLDGTRQLLPKCRSKSADFQRFIYEFYMFHHILNSLTTLDRRLSMTESGQNSLLPGFIVRPTAQPGSGALVGVLDGLFEFIKSITALRDTIRARRIARHTPYVRYEHLSRANELDVGIRNWDSGQTPGTPRWLVAQVWRQSTWIYLYRTVQKSKPSPKITPVVDEGISCLRQLHPGDPGQSIMLTPLFLLGCAAFAERQRPEIESAFDKVQAYRNFGNIKHARDIVRKLWTLMDAGDERSWDWEGMMIEMGLDFLIT